MKTINFALMAVQGASSVIETKHDPDLTLEQIQARLNKIGPNQWDMNTTIFPNCPVLLCARTNMVIYFTMDQSAIWLERFTTKRSQLLDLLPDFTPMQVAKLINKKLERMGV